MRATSESLWCRGMDMFPCELASMDADRVSHKLHWLFFQQKYSDHILRNNGNDIVDVFLVKIVSTLSQFRLELLQHFISLPLTPLPQFYSSFTCPFPQNIENREEGLFNRALFNRGRERLQERLEADDL